MARRKSLLGRIVGGLLGGRKRKPRSKTAPARKSKPAAKPKAAPSAVDAKRRALKSQRAAARKPTTRIPRIQTFNAEQRAFFAYQREQAAAERTMKRKPMGGRKRRNPDGTFAAARAQSRTFHGKGHGHVLELSKSERPKGASRYVVPIGEVYAEEYLPPRDSKRAGAIWRHRSGDAGAGKAPSRGRKLLVADPRTHKVFEIDNTSSQRFDPHKGIVK